APFRDLSRRARSEEVREVRHRQSPPMLVVSAGTAVGHQYPPLLDEHAQRPRLGLRERAGAGQEHDAVSLPSQVSALDLLACHEAVLAPKVFEEAAVRFAQPSHRAVLVGAGRALAPGLTPGLLLE